MPVNTELWSTRKYTAWRRIWEDLEIGYLDVDLLPILVLVNRDRYLYTTSSCSGRVVLMDTEYPWEKHDPTGIIFKSHKPVDYGEILLAYSKPTYKNLWLIVTGPIIHLYAFNSRIAMKVLSTARRSGFKHSGVMHYSRSRGLFIELVTGVYTAQLLKSRNNVYINETKLRELVDFTNTVLLEGKKRLDKLYQELSKILPENPDPVIETDLKQRGFVFK